ncbi:MAG: hypothetical protein QOG59_213, partial [Solirubrobacteraceae bacterium]|nr:hypothetical protein [Solirubrobacteraceae bacterium]
MNLRFHRAQALVLLAAVLTLSAVLTPAIAQAGVFHVNRVGPQGRAVTGMISFSASSLGPRVRRVVYLVDGHWRFTARRAPFRFGRTGRLDTSGLASGAHVLTIKAVLASGHVKVARKHIVVSKPVRSVPVRSTPIPVMVPVGAKPASAGGSSVVNFNRETYSYSSPLSLTAEAKQYQVMVLQSTDGALVHALHAANPALKILVYQHPYFSRA